MPDNILNGLDGISSVASPRRSTVISTNANLSTEDFYKLMAAQMKYQDPSNPTDSTDMLNQMTQMSMISAIESMNNMTKTTYAASMMGKEVTINKYETGTKKLSGQEKGVVTGVNLSGKDMTVWVNGKEYKLADVVQIGNKGSVQLPNTTGSTGGTNSGSNNSGSLGGGTTGGTTAPSNLRSTTDNNGSTITHQPATNTAEPSQAIPPTTVITENGNGVPVYHLKDNEGKIVTPVG